MSHDSLPSGLVTFLFTDIEGSTRLAHALGPAYRDVLAEHRRLLRHCLGEAGGAELLTEGDSFFAVFADAAAAVRACIRAQRALAGHRWPGPDLRPRVRMGLHSGHAVAAAGEYASLEVHRAARVAAAAAGDQVLCTAATAALLAAGPPGTAAVLAGTAAGPGGCSPVGPGLPDGDVPSSGRSSPSGPGLPDAGASSPSLSSPSGLAPSSGVASSPGVAASSRVAVSPGGASSVGEISSVGGIPSAGGVPPRTGTLPAGAAVAAGAGHSAAVAAGALSGGVSASGAASAEGALAAGVAAPQDPAPQDPAPQDPAPQDLAPQEPASHEPVRHDAASRHAAGSAGVPGADVGAGRVDLIDLGLHRLRGFDDHTRLYQIAAPGLARDFPPLRTVDDRCHNLPEPLTRFVGRSRDRVEVTALLRRHRLVTVWGAGGVGKTRLAVEVARDLLRPVQPVAPDGGLDRLPDGAWLADLAALPADAPVDEVAGAIAAAFGVRPGAAQGPYPALVEYLSPRRCLMLLDTCDAARGPVRALLARLLASCPGLRVLATGRSPVGVPGEVVWHLDPLGRIEAAELLADRLGTTDAGTVGLARLAGRLGGLPAVLELVVPRLRLLPPGLLADRLLTPGADPDTVLTGLPAAAPEQPRGGDEVDGPVPHRHTSLRANLLWSYRRVSAPAARLLRWLSAWPGPVDLAAVEWLAAGWLDRGTACAAIADLVDAALVEVDLSGNSATYRLLDPIRWPARLLAAEHGDAGLARARYQVWQRRNAWVPTLQPLGEPVAAG